MNRRGWIGSIVLIVMVLAVVGCLAAWKYHSIQESARIAASHPEHMESITVVEARQGTHRRQTTSIGTVLALKSVTLRNEVAGTVHDVTLTPGQVVDQGTLLVALDVSVEEAELRAQEAQAVLAETVLARMQRANENQAVSELEVDRARAERDVALAHIARIKAIIDRKTIRAPFRARVGLSDVHAGQYLQEGTMLTTLQSVDDAVHVDFTVVQQVASVLREGMTVEVLTSTDSSPIMAEIIAIDSRINELTRNAMVRARVESGGGGVMSLPLPGSSVRVRVAVGEPQQVVLIPASAMRKGPAGDHVYVIAEHDQDIDRAHLRSVQAGPLLGDDVVVYSGLQPGERVAASGSFKLREGVRVVVMPDGASATAASN